MKLIAGPLLVLASSVLTLVAWYLYDAGVPGAPRHPVQVGLPSVTVATAPDVGVAASIDYLDDNKPRLRDSAFDADRIVQSITVDLGNARAKQSFVVAIELNSGAQLAPGFYTQVLDADKGETVVEPAAPVTPKFDKWNPQRFLFKITTKPGGDGRLSLKVTGKTLFNAIAAENARISFESPIINPIYSCAKHSNIDDADKGALEIDFMTDQSCTKSTNAKVSLSTRFVEVPRFDFVQPAFTIPANGRADVVEWQMTEDGVYSGFRPTASFVDINLEARGQRQIFISGVAIGLGAASLPPGIQLTYLARRAGRRN